MFNQDFTTDRLAANREWRAEIVQRIRDSHDQMAALQRRYAWTRARIERHARELKLTAPER